MQFSLHLGPTMFQRIVTGLICLLVVLVASLAVDSQLLVRDGSSWLEPRMLDIERAAEIRVACPKPDTYCLPRLLCRAQDVVYDRLTGQFIQGDEFVDVVGCGAFNPTWTYVCCSKLDRVDNRAWAPRTNVWFYPSSLEKSSGNLSSVIPILLPWSDYESDSADHPNNVGGPFLDEDNEVLPVKDGTRVSATMAAATVISGRDVAGRLGRGAGREWTTPLGSGVGPFQPLALMQRPTLMPQSLPVSDFRLFMPVANLPPSQLDLRFARAWMPFEGGLSPMHPPVPSMFFPPPPNLRTVVGGSPVNHRTRRALIGNVPMSYKMPPSTAGLWAGQNSTTVEVRTGVSRTDQLIGPGGNSLYPPLPQAYNINGARCGISAPLGVNARILPGRRPGSQYQAETDFGEYPWHVGVVNGETGDYLCAGALISARFVLTVAHCVRKYQATYMVVRLGDWDLASHAEILPSYDAQVLRVIVHEDYYAGSMQNDIALLQLKIPLDLGAMPHVGTLCLPSSSDLPYSGCVVTGWGQQLVTNQARPEVSAFSSVLKQTRQELVGLDLCERSLRPYMGPFYQLPRKGSMCAYDRDGGDSCFGDGGGALACLAYSGRYPSSGQYRVVGLVSWGVGCGLPGVPSVYTAVSDYLDWIWSKVDLVDPYSVMDPIVALQGPIGIVTRSKNDTTTASTTTPVTMASQVDPVPDYIDLAFGRR